MIERISGGSFDVNYDSVMIHVGKRHRRHYG